MADRLRGRVVELRSWLYRTNQRSFLSEEHRADHHRRRARSITARFRRTDPESAYPLIGDIEEAFAPAIDELKPAAIHVQDPMLLGIAVRSRNRLRRLGIDTALVFDAHEWTRDATSDHALEVSAMIGLENRLVGEMSDCVTVSQDMAEEMAARFPLSRPPTIVPDAPWSGSDSDYADVRTDAGVPRGTPLVVYTGVLEPGSGVEDLVAALESPPPVARGRNRAGRCPAAMAAPPGAASGGRLPTAFRGPCCRRQGDFIPPHRRRRSGSPPTAPEGHSPVPTKYRDYLVAGLPMVATDVGTSAEEIRGTGVGVVVRSRQTEGAGEGHRQGPGRPRPVPVAHHRGAAAGELLGDPRPGPRTGLRAAVGTRTPTPAARRGAHRRHELRWAGLRMGPQPARGRDRRHVDGLALPDNPFTHRVDHALPRAGINTLDRKVQLLLHELVDRAAVIMESGIRIAAPEPGDVRSAATASGRPAPCGTPGTAVALLFHGSDIRRPDIHLRTHRWSPFANPRAAALTAELRKRTRVAHEQLAAWDGPVMVSTPDLIPITPGAVWTPVVVDLDRLPRRKRAGMTQTRRAADRVHMPSRSLLKGSHLIDPVLRGLARDGVIRYRRVERVPHEAVPQLSPSATSSSTNWGWASSGWPRWRQWQPARWWSPTPAPRRWTPTARRCRSSTWIRRRSNARCATLRVTMNDAGTCPRWAATSWYATTTAAVRRLRWPGRWDSGPPPGLDRGVGPQGRRQPWIGSPHAGRQRGGGAAPVRQACARG